MSGRQLRGLQPQGRGREEGGRIFWSQTPFSLSSVIPLRPHHVLAGPWLQVSVPGICFSCLGAADSGAGPRSHGSGRAGADGTDLVLPSLGVVWARRCWLPLSGPARPPGPHAAASQSVLVPGTHFFLLPSRNHGVLCSPRECALAVRVPFSGCQTPIFLALTPCVSTQLSPSLRLGSEDAP